MLKPLLLLATLLLLAPATAGAATVHVDVAEPPRSPKFPSGPPTASVVFAAANGEANVVTVAEETPGVFVVTDAGAPLTPGSGCTLRAPGTAACTVTRGPSLSFDGVAWTCATAMTG